MIRMTFAMFGLTLLVASAYSVAAPASSCAAGCYDFTADVALGAPGFQDHLTYDPAHARLYVSHYDQITVVDTKRNEVVGSIGPFHDTHGVAIVDRLGKGFADSGADSVVKVFSLRDLHITKVIKVSADPARMVYDGRTGLVVMTAGDSRTFTTIDPVREKVVRTMALPGRPESLALDGRGAVYVNLSDVAKIAKIDIFSGRLEAQWPLLGCKGPHGLAYEPLTHRLFSGCANGRLIVVDAANGRNLANLPIGSFSDSVAIDLRRHLIFSPNGVGTLTVIEESAQGEYRVMRTIPTFFGARNMAIDPGTGTLFLAHETMKIETPLSDALNLRFGWDGVNVAVLKPQPCSPHLSASQAERP